jgi:hypothetical protein
LAAVVETRQRAPSARPPDAGRAGEALGRASAAGVLRARVPEAAVAAGAAVAAALIYAEGRGTTFYYDEWNMVLERRENDLDAFLAPHNGHLSVIPVAVYRLFFELFGLTDYRPFRLLVIALHLVCAVLFFVLLRRRIDRRVAALATMLLLFLGTAWQDLLWPFQIGYLGSIAAGLGALLALERADRRGDVAASILLAVSCACSGLGIPFLLGAAVEVAWTRERVGRSWVVLAPAALYGLWYAWYGDSESSLSNLRHVPAHVADSLAGVLGGITGLGTEWGRPLAVAAVLLVLARLFAHAPITRRLAVAAVALLTFWTLTALTRGDLGEPDASRYIYPGAILVLLIAAELTTRAAFTARDLCVLTVLVAGAVVANLGALRDGAQSLREVSRILKPELAALELERATAPPDYRPDLERAPVIRADLYFAAIDALGSPATPADSLAGAAPDEQTVADRVLTEAGIRVEPGDPAVEGPPPRVVFATTPRRVAGSCVRAISPGGSLYVKTKRPFAVLVDPGASVEVLVRRLAEGFGAPIANVSGEGAAIRVPDDGLAVPWELKLTGTGPFAVCGTS